MAGLSRTREFSGCRHTYAVRWLIGPRIEDDKVVGSLFVYVVKHCPNAPPTRPHPETKIGDSTGTRDLVYMSVIRDQYPQFWSHGLDWPAGPPDDPLADDARPGDGGGGHRSILRRGRPR